MIKWEEAIRMQVISGKLHLPLAQRGGKLMKRRVLSDYLGHAGKAASAAAGVQLPGVIPGELRTSTRHTRCLFHVEQDEAVDVDRSCWKDFKTPRFVQFHE